MTYDAFTRKNASACDLHISPLTLETDRLSHSITWSTSHTIIRYRVITGPICPPWSHILWPMRRKS